MLFKEQSTVELVDLYPTQNVRVLVAINVRVLLFKKHKEENYTESTVYI